MGTTESPLRASPNSKESSRDGPFSGPGASTDRIFFLSIKPACVNILALSRPGSHTSTELPKHLATLRSHLARASAISPLPSPLSGCAILPDPNKASLGRSVLHYAFFPISQLFQASRKGPADLPDRTRGEAFACLHLLVGHWWKQWLAIDGNSHKADGASSGSEEDGQVWRQLLILAAVTLTGPPPAKPSPGQNLQEQPPLAGHNSPETSLEILKLIHALLCPRLVRLSSPHTARPAPKSKGWEWDGESDLPSLEETENFEVGGLTTGIASEPEVSSVPVEETRVVYPTRSHLKLAESPSFKSPLLHALTATLDLAVSAAADSSTLEFRSTAIEVARIIATVWLPATSPPSRVGQKLTPILPGVVSKVVRLLTGTPHSSDSRWSSPKKVLGPLVARALMLLTEVVGPVLSDVNTAELRAQAAHGQVNAKIRTLEELIRDTTLSGQTTDVQETVDVPPQGPLQTIPSSAHNTLKLTVQNLRLAMLSLDGRSPTSEQRTVFSEEDEGISSHSHTAAQQALVKLSETLLRDCSEALLWHERQVMGESKGSPDEIMPFTSLLLRWLMDLASETHPSETTHHLAQGSLHRLLDDRGGVDLPDYSSRAAAELRRCLRRIPPALSSHRGATAARLSNRISSLLVVVTSIAEEDDVSRPNLLSIMAPSLQSRSEVERWGSELVRSLQVAVTSSGLEDDRPTSTVPYMPVVELLNVATGEAKALRTMLAEWGRICATLLLVEARATVDETVAHGRRPRAKGPSATDSMTFFLSYARQYRQLYTNQSITSEMAITALSTSSSALLIVREMTRGFAAMLGDSKLSLKSGRVGKRARKQVHRFAEELVRDVMECWQEESQNLVEVALPRRANLHTDDSMRKDVEKLRDGELEAAAEQVKGLPAMAHQEGTPARPKNFGPALNLSFVSAATVSSTKGFSASAGLSTLQTRQALVRGHIVFQRSVQLELLALSASLLGPAYQSHLLSTLYPMVSALTHRSPSISRAASWALDVISYSTGYGDMTSCVRENVDYILGEASWRLVSGLGKELEVMAVQRQQAQRALSRGEEDSASAIDSFSLSQSAPLLSARTPPFVLTEVMRLLGPASLHLIEDSIDEVLDALDRFHGYDDICDALLGVLDRLLEVMKSEARQPPSEAKLATGRESRSRRTPGQDADLDTVLDWLGKRQREEHIQSPLDLPSAFDAVEATSSEKREDETTTLAGPTSSSRSQKLLVAILSKSLPFLSHSSAVIRARVLRLLGAGTQLLAPLDSPILGLNDKQKWSRQEDALLPLVNRAWPLIVARLGWDLTRPLPAAKSRADSGSRPLTEDEPFVHLQALGLLEIFAVHIPDFMSDRITKDAWPRMRLLLLIEEETQDGRNRHGRAAMGESRTTKLLRSGDGRPEEGVSRRSGAFQGQVAMLSGSSSKRIDPASPLYKLLLSTLRVLSPLLKLQGPRFPDETLWQLLSLPLYLTSLHAGQPAELWSAAVDVGKASKECDGAGTVWAVMRSITGGYQHSNGRSGDRWKFLEQTVEATGGVYDPVRLDVRLAAAEILSSSPI